MAKNSITDYSKTASLNTDIQSVDIDESCLPSGINNAIREIMADLAAVNDGTVSLTSPAFAAATIAGDLTVDTNTLHVDSTNNRVGIGTSSPSQKLTVQSGTSLSPAVNLLGAGTNQGWLRLGNNADIKGGDDYLGMTFTVGASERARIDGSGNLLVGKTTTTFSTAGVEILPIGRTRLTRDGGSVALFNRLSSDGNILEFYKDGTSVGSIGNDGANRLIVNSENTTGYLAVDGAAKFRWRANDFIPHDDNTKDLGHSATRWNDLYLGGGLRADTLTFSSLAGSERMRIDSSGNVGIGTSSPLLTASGRGNLTINGTSDAILTLGINGTYKGYMWANSTKLEFDAGGSGRIIQFNTTGNPRLIIDSSGNVGIGTAPASNYTLHTHNAGNTFVYNKFTNSTTGNGGGGNGLDVGISGVNALIYNYEAGNLQFATNASERLRIDSSGNVQIDDGKELRIYRSGAGYSGAYAGISMDAGETIVFKNSWGSKDFRLTRDGSLLVGTTLTAPTTGGIVLYKDSTRGIVRSGTNITATDAVAAWYNPNGKVGQIVTSGSSTAYNTSSDYRLKENVTGITDGIERIKQLNPSRFNFIVDADTTVDGFLAHEAATVVPEAVTGEKDAVDEDGNPEYQGIDQAKLVPLLTAALQEAITKIEDLETRIATLEGN